MDYVPAHFKGGKQLKTRWGGQLMENVLMVQVGRICLMTELMDTSLMSALLLPDDANMEYHYYKQCAP